MHQSCSGEDDVGVDRQLIVRAIDRHQNHCETIHIDPIHGRVLVGKYLAFLLRSTFPPGY